jgi:hypothetical protein
MNLLTKRRGKCQSLDEVKEQLKRELVAYSGAFERAEAIKVAALAPAGRASQKLTRGTRRNLECPHCEMEVPNLSVHLREIHGIGPVNSAGGVKSTRKTSAVIRPDLIACTCCEAHVAPRNMEKLMKKVHSKPCTCSEPSSTPKRPSSMPPQKLLCVHCGVSINAASAALHAKKCPRRRADLARTPARTPANARGTERQRPTAIRICEECGRRVQKREFAKHAAAHAQERRLKQYPESARRRASESRRKAGQSSTGAIEYPLDPTLGPTGRKIERRLDGAREFGPHYRERGRFGSHSAYDDYSEESGA